MGKESLKIFGAAMILGASSVGITDNYQMPQAELDGYITQSVEVQSPQDFRRVGKTKGVPGNRIIWPKAVIKIRNK